MDDLISRKAAIEALRRAEALTKAFGYHNVIETIRELPSTEPVRMKGEWVAVHDPVFADTYYCSVCKKEPNATDTGWVLSDFCPNCGADMRGEE